MMMRMHDITPDAAAESRSILESELDWLDNTLADNRRYLAGDRFSRASPVYWPFLRDPKMPIYHEISIPGALRADLERWSDRPVMRWSWRSIRPHRISRPSAGC
jgi:glutathione S-transferase